MEAREQFFRDLCENAHDLIQSVSPDGRFLYVNKAWMETLGYDDSEIPGLRVDDVIHPDSLEHCRQMMGRLMEGHEAVEIEADFVSKAGRRVTVQGNASCRFEDGVAVSTRGIFRDVTDRRRAREELDLLFDLSLDMLCVGAIDGTFKRVNPAFNVILGYEPEEIIGRKYIEFIHPDDREETADQLEQLAAGRLVVDFKNRFRSKYGEYRWLGWRATPMPERGLVFAAGRDITEEKRQLDAQEEIDRLFNVSQDMLCVAGLDGYFKRINPAFEKVLGYEMNELLSRQFIEFVHPDDVQETLAQVEVLAKGDPVVDFKNRYRHKDGSWRWLAWRSTPSTRLGNIYAVARDITEEMRIAELMERQRAELERSNADLERFAYAASHDLRAPLRRIGELAKWIDEDLQGELPPKVAAHVEKMRGQVGRMEALVDDLLSYSRAGRREGEIARVDTAALVREIRELLSPPAGLSVVADPSLPVLETAKAPLEQVLRNLIGNAVKHHDRPDGKVVVAARDLGATIEFSVADDGPGIPKRYHAKIFEMFQQLKPRDEVQGTGIGLSLVSRIVESHGGQVAVESGGGRGTTFRFTWPKTIETG